MIALLACSGVTFLLGYTAGVFAERCKSADAILEAQVDRELANRDAANWQAEAAQATTRAEYWRARCAPTFTTGPGSPWAKIDLEIERAAQ